MKKVTEDGEILDLVTHEVIARAPIYWKTPFNHDTDHEARSTALECKDKSLTQQQFAKDADINVILAKFMNSGGSVDQLPLPHPSQFLRVDEELDLQDRIITGYQVDQAWNALSAEVRNTLKNPATLVAYVEHCLERGDLEPLHKLGLARPPEPPEPPKPATVPNQAPAAANPPAAPAAGDNVTAK